MVGHGRKQRPQGQLQAFAVLSTVSAPQHTHHRTCLCSLLDFCLSVYFQTCWRFFCCCCYCCSKPCFLPGKPPICCSSDWCVSLVNVVTPEDTDVCLDCPLPNSLSAEIWSAFPNGMWISKLETASFQSKREKIRPGHGVCLPSRAQISHRLVLAAISQPVSSPGT